MTTSTTNTTQTKKTTNDWASNSGKPIEEQRFEFVLHINDNIICQRYFNIRDFNEESINSLEMKDLIDTICGMNNDSWGGMGIIPSYLKTKSIDYLWNNFNPYFVQTEENYKAPAKKGDVFLFQIKIDKRVTASAQFDNNYFTLSPKVSVDIRETIPSIMNEIRNFLSQKNYTKVESNMTL